MPNRNYSRGRAFEYERKKDWETRSLAVLRTAGSHGKFDLVAVQKIITLIQCKVVETQAAATRLIEEFRGNPPLPPGEYHQCLEVKVKGEGVRSVTV